MTLALSLSFAFKNVRIKLTSGVELEYVTQFGMTFTPKMVQVQRRHCQVQLLEHFDKLR